MNQVKILTKLQIESLRAQPAGIDDLVDSALAFVDTLRPFIDLASMETVAMVKPNPCVMVADGKVWCFDFLGRLRQITEQDRPFVFSVKGVYYLP